MRTLHVLILACFILPACVGGDDKVQCEDGVDCPEDCTDGVDNDGDGATDCEDELCDEVCVEDCTDGVDNDGDGETDCEDTDCDGDCPEDCTDTRDNDGDGAIDCEDSDCDGDCPEDCTDGRDNDGDGLADCEDIDCEAECPEDCTDKIDNDADGAVDCEDEECDGSCPEVCADGRDNDGDGLVDCEDGDCATDTACIEDCSDGIDNDSDGLVDCLDDECWSEDCHPDGVQSYVKRGDEAIAYLSRVRQRVFGSSCSSSYTNMRIKETGQAFNIEGKVRTKPVGATTWLTCDWEVATASFGFKISSWSASPVPRAVSRKSFYVEPGCGIPSTASSFLPDYLLHVDRYLVVSNSPYRVWYPGPLSYTQVFRSSTLYTTSSGCSQQNQTSAYNLYWTPIVGGGTTYTYSF